MKFLERKIFIVFVSVALVASFLANFLLKRANFLNIAELFFYSALLFLVLVFLWLDAYLSRRFDLQGDFGIFFVIGVLVISGLYFFHLPGHEHGSTIEGGKMVMVMQIQTVSTSTRYTLSFIPPQQPIVPNKDTALKFRIYNADTGEQVTNFDLLYTQLVHLVIVDNELKFFNHIHPVLKDGEFSVVTQFPKNDLYHLYLNFQPTGGLEQQFGVSLQVGNIIPPPSTQLPDANLTKTFGNYNVTLVKQDDFRAKDMSKGLQTMTFGITYAQSGVPVTNLVPYLGAFGHLTLVNEKTYQYIHIHPITQVTEGQNQRGGPSVEFVPLALYGDIKPGVYRVFVQFNPGGNLFTADFTIEVK